MKHAREDYSRIQDSWGKIPDNEPVFIIRAQDVSSGDAVCAWADLNDRNGGDPELSRLARAFAVEMDEWPEKKPADLPPPPTPRGPEGPVPVA